MYRQFRRSHLTAALAATLVLSYFAFAQDGTDAPAEPSETQSPLANDGDQPADGLAPQARRQRPMEFTAQEEGRTSLKYLLYTPGDYSAEAETQTWPLLVFLHGAGERGDNLELVKVHGPPKLIESGRDFPFIVVSPQCPSGQRWSAENVLPLMDELIGKYKVDKDRVYLTGLSLGGFGTWSAAQTRPELFAAIAPICGGGDPTQAAKLKDLPIWVFHGGRDRTVPIARSEEMVKAIRETGSEKVKFTIYPEAGHDSWTESYDNPELYKWMLEQKLSDRQAPTEDGSSRASADE